MTLENYLKNKRVQTLLVAFTAILTLSITIGPSVFADAEDLLNLGTANLADKSANTPDPNQSGFGTPAKSQTSAASLSLVQSLRFTNAGFVQAGIGLRNVGSGTISIHTPIPVINVARAILYWTTMDAGTAKTPATAGQDVIYLNGERIVGTLIGSTASPCWGSPNIYVYRADVTGDIARRGGAVGDQFVSVQSAIVTSMSPWTAVATQQAESAHLIIVYRDSTTVGTYTQIFDAAGFPGSFGILGTTSFTAPFAVAHTAGKPVSIGYALADGQLFGVPQPNSKSFTWTSGVTTTTLATGEIYGRDPSLTSFSSIKGSLSDTPEYDVTANTPAGALSGTFTWNTANDCLTAVAVAVQS